MIRQYHAFVRTTIDDQCSFITNFLIFGGKKQASFRSFGVVFLKKSAVFKDGCNDITGFCGFSRNHSMSVSQTDYKSIKF